MKGLSLTRVAILAAGFSFLYVPIALLVIDSFNASRMVTVWTGFSTRWYGALLADTQMLDSAWTSVVVASASAAIATFVGTLAAFALVRFGRMRGRTLFSFAIHAPLVLPEVILGLSLLLVFVALGIDRGLATIILAHATLTMCFATVVVRARLVTFDRALEEAAADLGATPSAVFLHVTLPIIAPAIVSAFLLAFTLSLDDLVIASFVSGPGATTLPMRIYSQVRLGVTPEINALSTLMLALVGFILLAASRLGRLVR
jgi:putrescine transport system permease protein